MVTIHSIKTKIVISLIIIFICVLVFQFIFIVPRISRNEAWFIIIFITISLLFSLLVILLIIHLSLRPLAQLIKRIKAGNKIDFTGYPEDEIGELTFEYNKIYTNLYESIEKLKISENKFRALFNNTNDEIFIHDSEGNILEINQVVVERLGYCREELLEMKVSDIDTPKHAALVRPRIEALLRQGNNIFEGEHVTKAGMVIPVEISSRVIAFNEKQAILSVVRDIGQRKNEENEKKELEKQLLHAQKMEALGILASGIAHDFNNLLMGIQGNVSLLRLESCVDVRCVDKLSNLEEHIKLGTSLTRQLLGLAKGGKYEERPANINSILTNSLKIFMRAKKEIKVYSVLQPEIWTIEIDRSQIEQVLLNLFVNACQAMPEGGNLFINTQNFLLKKDDEEYYSLPAGKYIQISVTDTGYGIKYNILDRIFDPFFTTKAINQGSGLGLASSYGIIKSHKGTIKVDSKPGKGSTFTVYLPACTKEVKEKISKPEELVKGSETLLFVDDEVLILKVVEKILHKLGYTVLIAQSGKEAVEIYNKEYWNIAMVILDMTMPVTGGRETFLNLKKINPDIKVLLCSGYGINSQAVEIMKQGCSGFIHKPFNHQELSMQIRKILDRSTSLPSNGTCL